MTTSRALRFIAILLLAAAATMSLSTSVAQEQGTTVTVTLQEFEGSGISGTAILSETPAGGTRVSMELRGQALDGNHPTHIHTGTCDDFDPNPLYPLETIDLSPVSQAGVSETDVAGVPIATLQSGNYVILVHQSPEELTTYLVCGDIGSGEVGVGDLVVPTGGSAQTHHMPEAGVGPEIAGDRFGSPLVLTLSAFAVLSLVGASALRRSRR
jgi:hypothetical protein